MASLRIGGAAGAALLVALAACGDSTGPDPGDPCMIQPLPLSAAPQGPVVVDVGLELQPGEGVIIVATATDPQGSENLFGVLQTVGVFPDLACEGVPIVLLDDLAGSGVEETFGTAVSSGDNPDLYAAIAARSEWPVYVSFTDKNGNKTEGNTMARVIR